MPLSERELRAFRVAVWDPATVAAAAARGLRSRSSGAAVPVGARCRRPLERPCQSRCMVQAQSVLASSAKMAPTTRSTQELAATECLLTRRVDILSMRSRPRCELEHKSHPVRTASVGTASVAGLAPRCQGRDPPKPMVEGARAPMVPEHTPRSTEVSNFEDPEGVPLRGVFNWLGRT
jgi:hypothetical protein